MNRHFTDSFPICRRHFRIAYHRAGIDSGGTVIGYWGGGGGGGGGGTRGYSPPPPPPPPPPPDVLRLFVVIATAEMAKEQTYRYPLAVVPSLRSGCFSLGPVGFYRVSRSLSLSIYLLPIGFQYTSTLNTLRSHSGRYTVILNFEVCMVAVGRARACKSHAVFHTEGDISPPPPPR